MRRMLGHMHTQLVLTATSEADLLDVTDLRPNFQFGPGGAGGCQDLRGGVQA